MTPQLIVDSNGGAPFEDGLDRGRILITGDSTDKRLFLDGTPVAARGGDAGFGPHLHHDIEEVFMVRTGTLEFLLGSEVTRLVEGDVVRVPPGTRHGYRMSREHLSSCWFGSCQAGSSNCSSGTERIRRASTKTASSLKLPGVSTRCSSS